MSLARSPRIPRALSPASSPSRTTRRTSRISSANTGSSCTALPPAPVNRVGRRCVIQSLYCPQGETAMKATVLVFFAAAALAAGAASAQSGAEVLKTKGCNNCHESDKKKVGPAYKDIAKKKGQEAALTAKLKEGKSHPKVAASDAELKARSEEHTSELQSQSNL